MRWVRRMHITRYVITYMISPQSLYTTLSVWSVICLLQRQERSLQAWIALWSGRVRTAHTRTISLHNLKPSMRGCLRKSVFWISCKTLSVFRGTSIIKLKYWRDIINILRCARQLRRPRLLYRRTEKAVYFGTRRGAANRFPWCSMRIYCRKFWIARQSLSWQTASILMISSIRSFQNVLLFCVKTQCKPRAKLIWSRFWTAERQTASFLQRCLSLRRRKNHYLCGAILSWWQTRHIAGSMDWKKKLSWRRMKKAKKRRGWWLDPRASYGMLCPMRHLSALPVRLFLLRIAIRGRFLGIILIFMTWRRPWRMGQRARSITKAASCILSWMKMS